MARVFLAAPLPSRAVEQLQQAGLEVTVSQIRATEAELRQAFQEYDGVITLLTNPVTAAMLAGVGPQLKVIANYAVGYDNIDVKAATERGIVVTNTPGVVTYAVAEHTVALLLALTRRVVEADRFMRAGQYHGWEPELMLGVELRDKTLGVVGGGRIGLETARIAQRGFNVRILYNDLQPNQTFETGIKARFVPDLDQLLAMSDIVSLHVPLLPSTFHLLNEARLQRLKPTALLINTARGAVVDEAALVTALRNGRLRGAALDVFEHEPKLALGLSELSNVVLTPHVASATAEARLAMAELAVQNVLAVLRGQAAPSPVVISV